MKFQQHNITVKIIYIEIVFAHSSNEISSIETYMSTIYGIIIHPHNDQLQLGLQLNWWSTAPVSQRSGFESHKGLNFLGPIFRY